MGKQPFKEREREELRKKVVELYQAGLTFREVSKKLKISHETARQLWLSTPLKEVS